MQVRVSVVLVEEMLKKSSHKILSIYLPIHLNPRGGTSDGYSGIPSAEGVSWNKVIEKVVR